LNLFSPLIFNTQIETQIFHVRSYPRTFEKALVLPKSDLEKSDPPPYSLTALELPGTFSSTHSYAPSFHLLTPSAELGFRIFRTRPRSIYSNPVQIKFEFEFRTPPLSPLSATPLMLRMMGPFPAFFYVWGCRFVNYIAAIPASSNVGLGRRK